jgi:hypothetical protein
LDKLPAVIHRWLIDAENAAMEDDRYLPPVVVHAWESVARAGTDRTGGRDDVEHHGSERN